MSLSVYINTGNRCGHNVKLPQLDLPVPSKKGLGGLPRILTLAQERFEEFFHKPEKCPLLQSTPKRKTRSERREAYIRVGKALLQRLDLVTLCCGTPTQVGFIDISMQDIMVASGLNQRRCERAIRQIRNAGFLSVMQPRGISSEGKYFGCRAIRVFTENFFVWLGLDIILKKERQKATQRLQQKANKMRKRIKELLSRPILKQKLPRSGRPLPRLEDHLVSAENRKRWLLVCAKYMKEDPGGEPQRWRRLTNQELGLPENYRLP